MQQDMEQTSLVSNHNHVPVIREWGHKLVDGQVLEYPALYGCTKCDITSVEVFKSVDDVFVDHTTCGGATKCFGCKAKSLQLNAGDAKGSIISGGVTQKQDDAELAFYRDARKQGVQPESTKRAAVEKALEASEVLNKPYDGGSMPKAQFINEKTVEVMKEVGAV